MKPIFALLLIAILVGCNRPQETVSEPIKTEPKTGYGQDVAAARKLKEGLESRDREIAEKEKALFEGK